MKCLQCSSPIVMGRVDRKFCSVDCKNKYHNASKVREHAVIKKISLILKKNRRILERLVAGQDESSCSVAELSRLGFDFNFHTHYLRAPSGEKYKVCFNYGYVSQKNERIKIIKCSTVSDS